MTESERLTDNDVAVAEVIEVVEVGATKAGRLDGNLDFVAVGFRKLTILLEGVN